MQEALHPFRDEPIIVSTYIREFGQRAIGSEIDNRPRARCRLCRSELRLRGGLDGKTIRHFAHFPESGFCPTKKPLGTPYLGLAPRVEDPMNALALKQIVIRLWTRYFTKTRELVPCLSPEEFIMLIERANEHRIWMYAGLQAWEIPYVLVVLADFPVNTSVKLEGKPLRKYWFRFFYDAHTRHIQDLWIDPPAAARFFRSSYQQPQRGIPRSSHLVNTRELQRTGDFLNTEVAVESVRAHRLIPPILQRLLV